MDLLVLSVWLIMSQSQEGFPRSIRFWKEEREKNFCHTMCGNAIEIYI